MSRMILRSFLVVVLVASAADLRAEPIEITDIAWNGGDVVLTLSDSAGYSLDLARSDTSEAVFLLPEVALDENLRSRSAGVEASTPGVAISIPGPDGRMAVLSQRTDGSVTLRVHTRGNLGYATLWRPFVRQLVVHTFRWDGLSYGEGQYYQGLIALEQKVDEQAEELLAVAASTGDARAAAALGSRYARLGDDSLALQYLRDPRTAEAHAALAAVLERRGDTAEAARHLDQSRAALATGEAGSDVERGASAPRLGTTSPEQDEILQARQRNVWLLVVFGLLGLFLLAGFLIAASRRRRRGAQVDYKRATAPAPPTRETHAFKVVRTESTEGSQSAAGEATSAVIDPVPATVEHEIETPAPDSEPQQPPPEPPIPPRAASPTPWTSAATHPPPSGGSQAADLQARLRAAELRPGADEPTVAAARRLKLSRDNVELRKRMEAASEGREGQAPD